MSPLADANIRRLLPLVVASFVASTAGVAAVTMTVEGGQFALLAHLLVCVGYVGGVWALRAGRSLRLVGALVFATAFTAFVLARAESHMAFVPYFFPAELTIEDLGLAGLVVWLTVAFSFCWSHRTSLLWGVVSSLAVLGVVGTVNLNVGFIVDFFVYLLAALFALGYENLLAQEEAAGHAADAAPLWARLRNFVATCSILFLITGAAAVLIGAGLHRTLPRPNAQYLRARLERFRPILGASFGDLSDEFRIGAGPIQLSKYPVMYVKTDRLALWRARVYDTYGDSTWRRSGRLTWGPQLAEQGGFYVVPRRRLLPRPQSPALLPVHAQFELAASLGDALPAPAQAVRLRIRSESLRYGPGQLVYGPGFRERRRPGLRVRADRFGCLSVADRAATVAEYEVDALVAAPTDDVLTRAPRATAEDFAFAVRRQADQEELLAIYTQVPARVEDQISRVVRDDIGISGDEPAIAQLRRIEDWLLDECRYTLKAPATPRKQDAVVYFLRSSRRGACDMYASAFVLMARSLDIPARIVTGFNTGAWDRRRQALVVTGEDAHAWAEAFFPGHGWLAFDPRAQEGSPRPSLWELFSSGRWSQAARDLAKRLAMLVVLGALGVWAVSVAIDSRVLSLWLGRRRRRRPRDARSRVALAYEEMCGRLAKRGLGREPWQTVTEHLMHLGSLPGWRATAVAPAVRALSELFWQARYSHHAVGSDEVRQARRHLARLGKALRRGGCSVRRTMNDE